MKKKFNAVDHVLEQLGQTIASTCLLSKRNGQEVERCLNLITHEDMLGCPETAPLYKAFSIFIRKYIIDRIQNQGA